MTALSCSPADCMQHAQCVRLSLTGRDARRSRRESGGGAPRLRGWQGDQPQHLGEAGQHWEPPVRAAAEPREHAWRKRGNDEEDQGQRAEEQVLSIGWRRIHAFREDKWLWRSIVAQQHVSLTIPCLRPSWCREREELLREQREKQKERMERYLERSLADSKKIVSHFP